MADRTFYKEICHLTPEKVLLDGTLITGLVGVVGVMAFPGVTSITRTGVGGYTINLQDKYYKLVSISVLVSKATGMNLIAEITSVDTLMTASGASSPTIGIQFYDTNSQAAADPVSCTLYFSLRLQNSVG